VAQDVPPPPRPADAGPGLADTMKFIVDKLGSMGRVNYVTYIHDNTVGNDWNNKFSAEASNVRQGAQACRIDYHWWQSRNGEVIANQDLWFYFQTIQEVVVEPRDQDVKEADAKAGHPEWTTRVDPPVFVIKAKWSNGEGYFYSYDESLAGRVAKALVHAVELCGGGNKEPF
jgi:hypothetical protein